MKTRNKREKTHISAKRRENKAFLLRGYRVSFFGGANVKIYIMVTNFIVAFFITIFHMYW